MFRTGTTQTTLPSPASANCSMGTYSTQYAWAWIFPQGCQSHQEHLDSEYKMPIPFFPVCKSKADATAAATGTVWGGLHRADRPLGQLWPAEGSGRFPSAFPTGEAAQRLSTAGLRPRIGASHACWGGFVCPTPKFLWRGNPGQGAKHLSTATEAVSQALQPPHRNLSGYRIHPQCWVTLIKRNCVIQVAHLGSIDSCHIWLFFKRRRAALRLWYRQLSISLSGKRDMGAILCFPRRWRLGRWNAWLFAALHSARTLVAG